MADASSSKSRRIKFEKEREEYIANMVFPFCDDISKYERIEKIGQGTFGEVFKARLRSDPQKFVAMKKVLMDNETEGFPITSVREVNILKLVNHENIVNFIEVCRVKSTKKNNYRTTFYMVMDFCEHDLAGLIFSRNMKFSLAEIKTVMQQLLNAIYYLHCNKLIHRDVKAANILLTQTGILKLGDFGLARSFSINEFGPANNFTNKVVTLWYRPPEILLGDRNYGPPVDLWSTGCVMAEMWTRNPILKGFTEQHQLKLIVKLCGSITPEVWPGVERLSQYRHIELPQDEERKVKKNYTPYLRDPYAVDLLDQLLTLDPLKRIDADTALNHEFFWKDPLPTDLSEIMAELTQSMFEFKPPYPKRYFRMTDPPSTSKKRKL